MFFFNLQSFRPSLHRQSMSSTFFSGTPPKKLPSVLGLDPHIYDPSTSDSDESFKSVASSASQYYEASENASDVDGSKTVDSEEVFNKVVEESNPKYLDYDDFFHTKELLTKVRRNMVESSCHHERKLRRIRENHEKLEESINDNITVLNEFATNLDEKMAIEVENMVKKLDPNLRAMEEIAKFSAALDAIEEYLDATSPEILRAIDTIDRATANLKMQSELDEKVKYLEEQSYRQKSLFEALEADDKKIVRNAVHVNPQQTHYGTSELCPAVIMALMDITEFQEDLFTMKRYYTSSRGFPRVDFEKIDSLLDDVKKELSEKIEEPLLDVDEDIVSILFSGPATGTSMTSVRSDPACLSSSNALEHAISPNDGSEYDIEAYDAHSSIITVGSTQDSTTSVEVPLSVQELDSRSVDSTQSYASQGEFSTAKSSETLTDDVTQTSPSNQSFLDQVASMVSSLNSGILTDDETQATSSLKTARSLYDCLTSDTHTTDSSSTIAI